MKTYLTVEEVAKRLRVSRMTIYRMCHAGTMPNVLVNRSYRIPADGFERWLEENTTTPKGGSDA